MKREQFTIGQEVFYTLEYRKGDYLLKGEVTKVGTKYVTVNDYYRFTYGKGTLKEFGGQLYLSEQEFYGEMELENAYDKIKEHFREPFSYNKNGVSLEQVREILKILKLEQN